ncbi:MAG TPA: ATP phosphoribosyltransferase [Vitreimonas sp.]|uniref:ATP phosphoribosyltransferase n=1 Tax=Vitreimonas sp. TaxID=3069702 RepID=UPI002D24FE91|nr:ATP phosphoribosyltransferase [Vitreimonas sp.]HYD88091.1 ATP phosphoribosyltransferase [Vitreimonas sp.]
MKSQRLHIAIQKSGRLAEKSLDLIRAAGFRLTRSAGDLAYSVENAPIDLWCVRDDDIPTFVADGVADFGIVGRNVLAERADGANDDGLVEVMPLGFGRCRLCIAAPEGFVYDGARGLNGLRVATTYPNLLRRFLKARRLDADIVTMRGAVEVAPRLKLAEAICDLVSTGATLDANGLEAFETILESEAVLVRGAGDLAPELRRAADSVVARFKGVVASQGAKYVMMNAPRAALPEIIEILPGAEAPTVTPLAGRDDAVAVHAVCQESVFWETLEALKATGASAILVLPIEKMM